jgi:hypothetical protein
MPRHHLAALAFLGLIAFAPSSLAAQAPPDPATLLAAQRAAMAPLARIDGVWRGTAWTDLPTGRHEITQTERIGSFLDGTLKVIEGRGYDADGTVTFNAFGIISFDPARRVYAFHSYAQGRSGDFVMTITPDGYVWEIPAGPMTIRYTAVIGNGTWREVGDRIMPGREPVRFFEMNLRRVGDTDWPGAGAVPQRP